MTGHTAGDIEDGVGAVGQAHRSKLLVGVVMGIRPMPRTASASTLVLSGWSACRADTLMCGSVAHTVTDPCWIVRPSDRRNVVRVPALLDAPPMQQAVSARAVLPQAPFHSARRWRSFDWGRSNRSRAIPAEVVRVAQVAGAGSAVTTGSGAVSHVPPVYPSSCAKCNSATGVKAKA